jgi:integrase
MSSVGHVKCRSGEFLTVLGHPAANEQYGIASSLTRPSRRRDGWLKFTQVKTKVPVEIPVLPALQATIAASSTGDLTYLVGEHGRAFTPGAFSRVFRRWCSEAGLTECSPHGLRKASAIRAAEAGASVHTLMAIYGWLTMGEAQRYTEAVRRKKLSGAALVLLQRPEEAKDGT